ncbi:hypothetical protein CRE_21812 [Caenorhabditis remanei]|uniref:Uncharacterized protein n=1 Tax=Caenorhabditis remanei TaxID=31234 RepID=E3MEL7_CAERE|nr:hypothetical protein CRE_21812 [Caenorhabditis remanei]
MKLLLAVSTFALCAQVAVSIPEDVQQVVVDYMNRHRESFAVSLPAANMNAIVYNASLEKRTTTCAVAEHAAKSNRAILFPSLTLDKGRYLDHGDIDSSGAEAIMDLSINKSSFVHLQQYATLEDLSKFCTTTVLQLHPFTFRITKPLEGLKRGEPGSQCPNGKSEISEYMCKA